MRTSGGLIKREAPTVLGREDFGRVTAAMKGVTANDMSQSFGMPYHPGAEKYYKEAGLLK